MLNIFLHMSLLKSPVSYEDSYYNYSKCIDISELKIVLKFCIGILMFSVEKDIHICGFYLHVCNFTAFYLP